MTGVAIYLAAGFAVHRSWLWFLGEVQTLATLLEAAGSPGERECPQEEASKGSRCGSSMAFEAWDMCTPHLHQFVT